MSPYLSRLLRAGAAGSSLVASTLFGLVDQNRDGVSDLWAERFPEATPLTADTDGDGATNAEEAAAGTDPSLADSVFKAEVARPAGDLELDWTRVAGKHYLLEQSSDLLSWASPSLVDTTAPVPLASLAGAAGRAFWRVVAFDFDTDGDGLSDWEEAQVGSDHELVDTDGDGESDYAEVLAGTDPLRAPPAGTTYHLDAINGSDEGDGSAAHPWQTFKKALYSVQSGDTVLMHAGNYGTLIAGRTKDQNINWGDFALPLAHFTDWTTFKAAPGEEPHATAVDFGTKNTPELTSNNLSVQLPFTTKGNVDLFIRIEGLVIEDGVKIQGGKHVEIANCTISRVGDLNGSVTNIDNKGGVSVSNGRYITLRGNDITHVSIGIGAATHDFAVIGNLIHHNSHDGIRVWGGDNWLIEGNRIHDLDDGVDDADGASWNRHSDGMHIWTLIAATHNLTVRGNLFYHIESMGVMVNASTLTGEDYSNWVFENNVFGPVGGTLFHGGATINDRFVFRHNTIVHAPNDQWVSIYPTNTVTGAVRVMAGQKYNVGWPGCGGEGSIYNNIFADGSQARVYTGSPLAFTGHNLYRVAPSTGTALARGEAVLTALPYAEVPGNVQEFMDSTGGIIGELTAANQAIDAATTIGVDYVTTLEPVVATDLHGLPRDNRGDIGAFEVQGRDPEPEHYDFLPEPAAPLHFVDDFSDSRLDLQDPFLNTTDTTGILWSMPVGYAWFRTQATSTGDLELSTQYVNKPSLVLTSKRFANLTLSFDYSGAKKDCGVVFLYQDPANYCFLDFGGTQDSVTYEGRLVLRQEGADTVLLTFPIISGNARGVLTLANDGTELALAFSANGTTRVSYTGAVPFAGGAVGFYRDRTYGNGWDRVNYDDVQIDLPTAADLLGDLVP